MSLRDWLLRQVRRDLPDSVEDWKAGDIAVCSGSGRWCYRNGEPAPGPTLGEMREVVEVKLVDGCQFLGLVGYLEGSYLAACFTKIRGDKAEACSERFARLLKRQQVTEPELCLSRYAKCVGIARLVAWGPVKEIKR